MAEENNDTTAAMATPKRRFATKFILVAAISVAVGLALNLLVAVLGIQRLSDHSSDEIEKGLGAVSREYLENYIVEFKKLTEDVFTGMKAETKTFADVVQGLIDLDERLDPLTATLPPDAPFTDKLQLSTNGGWAQNGEEPTAVTVWKVDFDPATGNPSERVRKDIARTGFLDAFMPALFGNGAKKSLVYYVGPEGASYARVAPYVDIGGYLDEVLAKAGVSGNPHHDSFWWEFFYPKLYTTWAEWPKTDAAKLAEYGDVSLAAEMRQVTATPIYEDAAGAGQVMSLFHPVWNKDRSALYGGVGIDVSLNSLVEHIEQVRLGESGFAFLATSEGNVIAINDKGATVLGLPEPRRENIGVEVTFRYLKDSSVPAVTTLRLPADDRVLFEEVDIAGEPSAVVMQRLDPILTWNPMAAPHIAPQYWTIVFVVPKKEFLGALYRSQAAIGESTQAIVGFQVAGSILTLLIVLLGVSLISRRMTRALTALSGAAARIMNKDYDFRLGVTTNDEIGSLSVAFNKMVSEIRDYTQNLEGLVEQRTSEVKRANSEIRALNERLKDENLRLGTELDVARRIQLMVLPSARELADIHELDVDGYMRPADEVGGDYYDVLRTPHSIKIGVGDVTGHGLESGVLMLMVQTAVRTLIANDERDPKKFLNVINQVVFQNNQRMNLDRNLTLSLLDYRDGVLSLTGQHEEVIVVRANGAVERVDTVNLGFPVGLEYDIEDFIAETKIPLAPGDCVVLYTDGVTEAEDLDGRQYGIERLCKVVARFHDKAAREIKAAILNDVNWHIGEQKLFDDITMVVIKRR
jgi:sigma-B regulation protein RsbU (phosphoserine phosphatase)